MRRVLKVLLILGLVLFNWVAFSFAENVVGTPNRAFRPTIQVLNGAVSRPRISFVHWRLSKCSIRGEMPSMPE